MLPERRDLTRAKPDGFTRLELAATVSALALIGALALPLIAATNRDAARAGCFNNLRQVGMGVRSWAGAHDERVPWWTPVSEGGSWVNPKAGNAYVEYYYALSSELPTPKVLACPADTSVVLAPDWWTLVTNPAFGPNAVSYTVGLHAKPEAPRAIVSTDQNVRVSSGPVGCSAGVNNAFSLSEIDPNVGWNDAIHGVAGHLLLNDGTVEFASSERLRTAIAEPQAAIGPEFLSLSVHILPAR